MVQMKLSSPIYKLKRQAKLDARTKGQKLNDALNQIAKSEGFNDWGHLASCYSKTTPAKKIISQLSSDDMVLIAARPGHGKTLLALEVAAFAKQLNRAGYIFSLDYNAIDIWSAFQKLGLKANAKKQSLIIDTSNNICAEYIIKRLDLSTEKALVVIDYLQLLDQNRKNPPLNEQVQMIKQYANATGTIFVFVSQVDRAFELTSNKFPTLEDIRLPNPVDTSCFNRLCFLHDGDIEIKSAA